MELMYIMIIFAVVIGGMAIYQLFKQTGFSFSNQNPNLLFAKQLTITLLSIYILIGSALAFVLFM
ncbi:hypothetical protein [Jeotgalibacillus sp. R-1-5s-1]|uniref:hypothetical protein n=1 Tax=Jeotgalibacillus sp. R-1-5s-1 TaxID=2555897 RepID=UPI001068D8A5|nr:hypothetical protein [Jeotgalibacillus sp. R-1-5s-1]TFD94528.1 hypothetical protein E2491_13960 [Jeotgalibacillus sp. R-1-5s-1]